MGLPWGRKPVAQELSDQVKKGLIAEFSLEPGAVDKMRFSGKKGRYSNRPVQYIRIYDPVLVKGSESATPSYDALDRTSDNHGALLFEGRMEGNERVYFTDQRPPAGVLPL